MAVGATFASLTGRLGLPLKEERAAAAAVQLGPLATKVDQQVVKAQERQQEAEAACAAIRADMGELRRGLSCQPG